MIGYAYSSMPRPSLTLYIRGYCHLCDDMRAAIAPWRERFGFELEEVDVDDDPELEDRYGEKVPVLVEGEREICHYYLDEAALRHCFDDRK
jgi:thioredoxin reductase (NADPH)